MKKFLLTIIGTFIICSLFAQNETEVLNKVKAKLDKVNDYQATGKMKLDVSFINAPASGVIVYYKKPGKFKLKKNGGISILPKGGVSVNVNSLLANNDYTVVPAGRGNIDGTETLDVKLIPNDENSDVVLAKLSIDEKNLVIRKATVTTRENGTYEIQMSFGKFAAWGLPDKVVFIFNTKDYKVPKGITLEYESGKEKKPEDKLKGKKGKVEITYSNYEINKGLADSVFQ